MAEALVPSVPSPETGMPKESATNHELSRENIEAYMEGCEELAVRLDTVIKKTIEKGLRPVVLIPSRGAVPIFLLARKILNDLDHAESPFAPAKANYYPSGVFEYLEDQTTQPNNPNANIDVVLYPFTADVSTEGKAEWLAKKLRESSARAVLNLLGEEAPHEDLAWHQFIMDKLVENTDESPELKPNEVVKSLKSFPRMDNVQIILIDTVISGRASHDITSAFSALGHPVAPILAVDSTKGGKFQSSRREEIKANTPWDLMDNNGPFIDFPLITEDKGAALLGLCAVNFANFNEKGAFSKVSNRFKEPDLFQSCVWTLPPTDIRGIYLNSFQKFLDVAWRIYHNEEITDEEIAHLREVDHELTSGRSKLTPEGISFFVRTNNSQPEGKETASHIISLKLPDRVAQEWIQEFATSHQRQSQ